MNKARGRRIAETRRSLKFSQEELAQMMTTRKSLMNGTVTRGAIGNWERGFGITTANLSIVAALLGVTTGWLEAGEPLPTARDTKERSERPAIKKFDGRPVVEIDVRGGAGMGGEASVRVLTAVNGQTHTSDGVLGEWHFPPGYLSEIRIDPSKVQIIEVTGDSMTRPDGSGLLSGDRIMVDTSARNPSPPGIFVLWDGFGIVVKRLERVPRSEPPTIRIMSDNPAHPPYELTGDEVKIVGRVIWFARKM